MANQDPAIRQAELECLTVTARQGEAKRIGAALAMVIAAAFALALSTAARAATITVNSLADSGATGICVLRDAITAANTKTKTNGCAAGTGNNTIRFSVTGMIALASTLPQVTDRHLCINGPTSPGITVDGGDTVQVMQVASGATLNLKNLTIAHGSTEGFTTGGGGILNQGTLTATNCTFSGNGVGYYGGGGIENGGTLTVTNCTFSGNSGGFVGGAGGIDSEGTLTITSSTFSDNTGRYASGGVASSGTLTVTNSTFAGNYSGYGDGGIGNSGTLTVTNSTFSGNNGGIYGVGGIDNSGTLTVTNSTFSGNIAYNYSGTGGGGIDNSGTLTVTNSTFSGNNGYYGSGGIENSSSGSASVKNTILAGNMTTNPSGPSNCSGTIIDAGYNISDDATCGFGATGSRNSTNPLLDPAGLRNNGGPTQTIALDSESPAIDAIPPANCKDQALNRIITDQRGALRPDIGEVNCDIGAYEFQDLAGQRNCIGKSVSALVQQFGNIEAAALALGFPGVKALQHAIRISCGG